MARLTHAGHAIEFHDDPWIEDNDNSMIAPFYPISCTHSPLSPHPLYHPQSLLLDDRIRPISLFFPSSSSPLFPPLPLSLYPPVNKAEAWDYLTFIRFRGESASLTSKEARVEPGSAHCGTWRWAFDPCSTFFDDIPLLFAKDVASRPPRDTRTRRVFAGYRALPSTGRETIGRGRVVVGSIGVPSSNE